MKDRQVTTIVVETRGGVNNSSGFSQINGKASEDEVEIRQAASEVVEAVITKAKETIAIAAKVPDEIKPATPGTLMLSAPPMIQIDLVGSRTPSPDDVGMDISEQGEDSSRTATEPMLMEDTASLREYLATYIQEVISMAVPLAEEKLITKIEQMEIEDFTTKIVTGPWYLRLREAVSTFLQTICVCGERRNDTS